MLKKFSILMVIIFTISMMLCTYSYAAVTYTGDFETGNFSQYEDAPWNFVGAPAPTIINKNSDPSHVRQGTYSAKFYMPGVNANRCEIVPNEASLKEGDDKWFGFSTYLAPGYPTNINKWQVLHQWKNSGTGSPPLELSIGQNTSEFAFEGGYGHPTGPKQFYKSAGQVVTGQWVDWIVHVKFSKNASVGYIEAWRNGTQVVTKYYPPGGTLYPPDSGTGSDGTSYQKLGIYRDSSITQSATAYHDAMKTGTSYADVDPSGGTPPTSTIIDNDAGAPGYTTTGTWSTSGNTGYNGGTYKYVGAGASATSVWNMSVPSAATYKVSVIYKAGTNRATSAKFNVATASGTQSVFVNQTTNDLAWVTLGTWSFNAGNATVTLDAAGSSGGTAPVVIADAVKFEKTTPANVTLDNDGGAPGYTTTGTWSTSGNTGYNGGTYQYASAGSANTASWNPNLPAGKWKVSVIYKAGTNRATSAKYTVVTATGTQTAYVNQTANDLAWVTLGTWSMNAGGGKVTLDAAGSSGGTAPVVIADTVKFEYVSP